MATTAGTTARGFAYPGDTDAADVPAKMKALADSVEAYFTGAVSVGGTVTATTSVGVSGSGAQTIDLRDTSAAADRKRSRLRVQGGHTFWESVNDAYNAIPYEFADANHATGKVDFPQGITSGGVAVAPSSRGKSIIATTESRTNTAYGTLTTPDSVSVTINTGDLVVVQFQALWQESVARAARAAIFVGANQLKATSVQFGSPTVIAAHTAASATTAVYVPLFSDPRGLLSAQSEGAPSVTDDVTTGQVAGMAAVHTALGPALELGGVPSTLPADSGGGGNIAIDNLPAGTYTISVQFKSSSGSVTVKNRRLRVWTVAF
jgi:hypothetical protein